MTHGDQPGRGTGPDRNPGDSSSPPELSLAVLECDEGEAQAHLAALHALVQSVAGTVCVTEVTSTCLALAIDAPDAAMPRLKAGLKLGGATLVHGSPAKGGQLAVILAVHPFTEPNPQEQSHEPSVVLHSNRDRDHHRVRKPQRHGAKS